MKYTIAQSDIDILRKAGMSDADITHSRQVAEKA